MSEESVELSERLGILMSHALSQVDVEKLCASDNQKWSLIAFMIGCVCNSRVSLESRSEQIDVVAGVLTEIFDWPLVASIDFVEEAFDDADKGESIVELNAGSQSIRELESAADRLKVLLEANRG